MKERFSGPKRVFGDTYIPGLSLYPQKGVSRVIYQRVDGGSRYYV